MKDPRPFLLAAFVALSLPCGPFVRTAGAHDWYEGIKGNDGGDCCGGKDCSPSEYCKLPDGHEGIMMEGECSSIPWAKVIQGVSSPDGKPHVCISSLIRQQGLPRYVRCVFLAGGS